jgi:hypothetical protein
MSLFIRATSTEARRSAGSTPTARPFFIPARASSPRLKCYGLWMPR